MTDVRVCVQIPISERYANEGVHAGHMRLFACRGWRVSACMHSTCMRVCEKEKEKSKEKEKDKERWTYLSCLGGNPGGTS